MVSPIYFFTRGGCIWSDKMQPTIKKINQTLIKEQKIQIHNIDEKKSEEIYENIINQLQIESTTPLLYNSNIGSVLPGYYDENQIRKFLRAEPVLDKKVLKPIPQFDVQNSTKKDFDNWKKSVILWYHENRNDLPSNIMVKERMIDMVYNQFMAYRTKPKTIEDRLNSLEERVEEILKKIN